MVNVYESVRIHSHKPLKSKFKYKDSFQIFPSKRKLKVNGPIIYPMILQLSFQAPEPYLRYSTSNSNILTRKIFEKLYLLSFFTQFHFFESSSARQIKKFSYSQFPEIKRGQIEWYHYKGFDDHNVPEIIFPEDLETYLEVYDKINEEKKNIFRKSLYLFYSGLELKGPYPGQSFISTVSAIETLINTENYTPARCDSCKQYIYGVSKRFKDFILKYAYSGKNNKSTNQFINKLYDKRSKITHRGELLVADLFWDDEEHDVDWSESFLHKDLIGVTRQSLINWLILNS